MIISNVDGVFEFLVCLFAIILIFCGGLIITGKVKKPSNQEELPASGYQSPADKDSDLPKIETVLGCKCTSFDAKSSESEVLKAYNEALERGKREGFVPMIIVCDDSLLVETILSNSGCGDEVDSEKISAYRSDLLESPLLDGQEVLSERKSIFESSEDWKEWLEELTGPMEGGQANDRFTSYRSFETNKMLSIVLAEIPVENPWEVFAYLPFGGWNECPEASEIMAVSKYWYEKYGAVPAVISSDVLEFTVPEPISESDAMELAYEQFYFCCDIVDQGVGTIGALADTLRQSKIWYFWWD